MLTPVASPCMLWRKWSVLLLLVTVLLIEQVATTSDLNETLSVRKCHCNKYQAWDGNTCRDSDTTIFPIYNKIDFDPRKDELDFSQHRLDVQTSLVENVTVMALECPKGLFHSTITNTILLLADGSLLWLDNMSVLTSDIFCVEFFWQKGQTFFDAQICVPPPKVPHCCPPDHLLHQNGSCYPHQALQLPPLQLGLHVIEWDDVKGNMVNLTCDQHEFYRHISLGSEAQLGDTQPTATLSWRPKVWVPSPSWEYKYCVAPQQTETEELHYVAQVCFKDYDAHHHHHCNDSLCIRKCCPENDLMIQERCVQAADESEIWRPLQIPNQEINEQWKLVVGEPGCIPDRHFGEMHLLPNGFLEFSSEKAALPPSMYCLDNFLVNEENITSISMLCVTVDTSCQWRDTVIKVFAGLSCLFLVATLAVYLGVAELRDHTYGRCLISMVAAMLTAYLCIMCGTKSTNTVVSCYVLAFAKHLSALAMFFWLNVMCFDMWKILRGSTMQHHSIKQFLGYSLYAWGCPLVVSIVTLILDILAPDNIILPEFNDGNCWFREDRAYWAYFSGFILVLVLVNMGFFIHISVTLYQKLKQRTQTFETNSSRTNKTTKTKQQVWLFAKLFVVMGVVWIADALSALSHRKTCTYWMVTDIINALQGVFIFIVAVCNKDNLKKVKDAWRPRIEVMRKTFSTRQQHTQHTRNTLSIDDTESSRKTSITSLPRKISQASNIFFPSSSKKSATLNISDASLDSPGKRKGSNVSIKDVIPLASMQE